MKRVLIPTLSVLFLAFFTIPALADSPGGQGGGGGGGGGGGAPPAFSAYCQNPQSNQTNPPGMVQPGDPDSCVISVQSGQVAPGSTVTVFLQQPRTNSIFCAGGTSRPGGCDYQLGNGASNGAQIGRQDFRVPPTTPPRTPVIQTAMICRVTCQPTGVNTQGPGAVISTGPPPPPPHSFPFAAKVCTGENSGGTASPGQLDTCSVTASVGNSYIPGESVIVKPNSPAGSTVADCRGLAAGSYQTSGTITAAGSCRLTVLSGTVPPFEVLGTETVRLAADGQPGTPLQQWVNFCNAPNASGDSSCTAMLGFIPISGPGASLSPDPPVYAAGISASAIEGQGFSGTVATFWDADPGGSFADYAATIDWGDGTESTVGVTGGNAALGSFDVTGSHTYVEEGTYTISVSVSDIDTALFNSTTATSTARVGDAPLAAAGRDANSTNPFNGRVATLTDANPNGTLSDYSATIDWGDGATSVGTVSQIGPVFDVGGSHTYADLGPYTVTVHACDVGGSCADATSHLLVYGLSDGGNFVVGDGTAAIGSSVTFWGSQWTSENALSNGPAPDAFKGFADDPAAAPACGSRWTTGPGDSAGPPPTVPAYMAVVVASAVTKDGPRISGDSVRLVIVKTESGFGPDPGHQGTGTVVAEVC